MIRCLLIAAVFLPGCTTIHVLKSYSDVEPIQVNHRERSYELRYNYDLEPPELLVSRSAPEAVAGVAIRWAGRRLDLTDYGQDYFAIEREYAKQVISMTIRPGCSIAREGDGSTKFFNIGDSADKFIATLDCEG